MLFHVVCLSIMERRKLWVEGLREQELWGPSIGGHGVMSRQAKVCLLCHLILSCKNDRHD